MALMFTAMELVVMESLLNLKNVMMETSSTEIAVTLIARSSLLLLFADLLKAYVILKKPALLMELVHLMPSPLPNVGPQLILVK
jgi:hypothetical protein